MYRALFRVLPGPKWLKAILFLAAFVGVCLFLFQIGFPWLVNEMGWNENTFN